jgi:hypothetical protein
MAANPNPARTHYNQPTEPTETKLMGKQTREAWDSPTEGTRQEPREATQGNLRSQLERRPSVMAANPIPARTHYNQPTEPTKTELTTGGMEPPGKYDEDRMTEPAGHKKTVQAEVVQLEGGRGRQSDRRSRD